MVVIAGWNVRKRSGLRRDKVASKNISNVSFSFCCRAVEKTEMELDEALVDQLARKLGVLEEEVRLNTKIQIQTHK